MGIEAAYIIEGGRPNERRQTEHLIYDTLKAEKGQSKLVSSFWNAEKEADSNKLAVIFGQTATDVDVTRFSFAAIERLVNLSQSPTIDREKVKGTRPLPIFAVIKI